MINSEKKSNLIIRCISFVLVFILIFAFIETLTYNHNLAYDGWQYVYTGDIDVLIMGSSQADASFDAGYITEQTGKSTVILSSGAQSVKQVYFNLLEVLKYQHPELIVVEEFSVIEDTLGWMDEMGLYGLALSNLDGMKMSPLKLWAAFSTLGFEGYGVFHCMREAGKTERFLFTLQHFKLQIKRVFHPKEKDLSPLRGTLLHHPETIATQEQYEASLIHNVDESFELPKENIEYMYKIIELCLKNGIEIEFIKTPLIKNTSSISGHFAIEKYLNQKDYEINTYNLMDTVYNLNLEKDDFTDVNHVSSSGMQKVSAWFSSHINEKFQ